MSAENVNFLLQLREQIKLYHWQTDSFARHKATDDALKELDELIDSYVETYMGRYGRPRLTGRTATFSLKNLSGPAFVQMLKAASAHLQGPFVAKLKPSDTELVNLRDEFLALLHKLLYLATLR